MTGMVLLYVLAGFLLLLGGGEALVRGASALAAKLHIPPAIVGLTIVAAGTSMPELSVSLLAAWDGNNDVATGNVIGSNVYNIALILGLCALIRPLRVMASTLRFDAPVMVLAALAIPLFGRDLVISRAEGAALVLAQLAFLVWVVRAARIAANAEPTTAEPSPADAEATPALTGAHIAALLIGGLLMLVFGADLFVDGSVSIARYFNISERVIGLTLVAIGTSLPELVTSLVSTLRGEDDIAIGNIVGSNIFNVLAILGVTTLILPVNINPASVHIDAWWMIGLSAVLIPMMYTGRRLSRGEGGILLGASGAYSWMLLH